MGQDLQSRLRLWAIAIVMVAAFPVVAMIVASGVEPKYQSDLRAAIVDAGYSPTLPDGSELTISEMCSDPEMSGSRICLNLQLAGWLGTISAAGALVGGLLLAFVVACSLMARRSRLALLRLFRPGVYVTLVGVLILATADGLMAVGAIYLGMAVFLHLVWPQLLLVLGLGAVAAVWGVAKAIKGSAEPAVAHVVGRRLGPSEAPEAHALVSDMASSLGTLAPNNIVVGLDPMFYVTEADVEGVDERLKGRTLYLSLPLMHILTPGELRAVLGHELGHFRGSDTVYSRSFYPIYRGVDEALGRMGSSIPAIPSRAMLGIFMDGFVRAERAISRERELAADQVGAETASAAELGTALVKLGAYTDRWKLATESFVQAAIKGQAGEDLGSRFVTLVRGYASERAVERASLSTLSHPTDSHPGLAERLQALGVEKSDLSEAALQVAPVPAADEVVPASQQIEQGLSEFLYGRIRNATRLQAAADSSNPIQWS